MAKSNAKGGGDNVHSGPGSKKGRLEAGSVKPGGGDAGAEATEKSHDVEFAEGGDTHMFGKQEAGSRTGADKSPSTGKPDSSGPGEQYAEGGKTKMFGYEGSKTATAGITSAR